VYALTRLTSSDIETVAFRLDEYDAELHKALGCGLRSLALEAVGFKEGHDAIKAISSIQAAVIPVRSGLGEINGFAQTVSAIVRHIGMRSFVSHQSDVAGVAESFERGARLIFMSDDDRFIALCPERRFFVDNTSATALGFVTGLSMMTPSDEDFSVLVLGCGPLGCTAAGYLTRMGGRVGVCDRQAQLSRKAAAVYHNPEGTHPVPVDVERLNLREWPLLYDATNSADLIHAEDVTERTRIAAPGMPCGVTAAARRLLGRRLLHDPLQIGVATMAALGLKRLVTGSGEG